ncbi:MAG TPA: TadE family protein [Acidimicrobiia bacterium]|nr:TadE family protein [Acidimicrobiia bacterium]
MWSGKPSEAEAAITDVAPCCSRRTDRGAALIEMALALPILVMLLVGIVSAGIAYNHQLALTHAAREGGRYGATLPVESMSDWLDIVVAQTVQDATGALDDGVPGRYVCVAFVHPAGISANDSTASRELMADGSTSDGSAPCFADGRPDDERRVQVVVERESDFSVVFFSTTLTLDEKAVSKFEAAQ